MKKLLTSAAVLALMAAPALAGNIAAGDINAAGTLANSGASVSSIQGTGAQAKVGGNSAVVVGAVSGNYTSVQTGATAKAGPAGSTTATNAQQVNVGGTVAGGMSNKAGWGNGASGSAGGSQVSTAAGGSTATAGNLNVGGFVAMPNHRHGS